MSHSSYQAFPIELLPKSLEISHWLSFSVAVNSKTHVCCGRSRNLSVVKSQSYFISERLFFPLCEQQAKIAKLIKYITYLLLWESGFLASVMLNDAHQAATYEENWWLWTYQKVHTLQTILEPLSKLNEAKRLHQNDVPRKLLPSGG